jgi:hypothetical protein
MNTTTRTINDALSALLLALGFQAMAQQVKTERDTERLSKYARVIVRNMPADKRAQTSRLLSAAGLQVS